MGPFQLARRSARLGEGGPHCCPNTAFGKVRPGRMAGVVELLRTIFQALRSTLQDVSVASALLGLSLGIVAGAAFGALVNRLALYNYALQIGARVPAEGAPHLSLAVTLFAFAQAAVYLMGAFVLQKVLMAAASQFGENGLWLFYRVLFLAVFVAIASSVHAFFYWDDFPSGPSRSEVQSSGLFVLAMVLTAASIAWPKPSSAAVAILVILVVTVRLFDAGRYGEFLRATKFGGGVDVELLFESTEGETCRTFGGLVVSTTARYVIWHSQSNVFSEIPVSRVRRLRYASDELLLPTPSRVSVASVFLGLVVPGPIRRAMDPMRDWARSFARGESELGWMDMPFHGPFDLPGREMECSRTEPGMP